MINLLKRLIFITMLIPLALSLCTFIIAPSLIVYILFNKDIFNLTIERLILFLDKFLK
jgi:hypothetical protein